MCVRKEGPIAAHGVGKPDSHSMFDARLGSSDALREGEHSLPSSTLGKTLATATPVVSDLLRRDVFEGVNRADGYNLRRSHGTDSKQQTMAGWEGRRIFGLGAHISRARDLSCSLPTAGVQLPPGNGLHWGFPNVGVACHTLASPVARGGRGER